MSDDTTEKSKAEELRQRIEDKRQAAAGYAEDEREAKQAYESALVHDDDERAADVYDRRQAAAANRQQAEDAVKVLEQQLPQAERDDAAVQFDALLKQARERLENEAKTFDDLETTWRTLQRRLRAAEIHANARDTNRLLKQVGHAAIAAGQRVPDDIRRRDIRSSDWFKGLDGRLTSIIRGPEISPGSEFEALRRQAARNAADLETHQNQQV